MPSTLIDEIRLRRLLESGAAKALRLGAGVSLRAVAADARVAPSTVSRWERGLRSPRGQGAHRYLRTLDRLTKA